MSLHVAPSHTPNLVDLSDAPDYTAGVHSLVFLATILLIGACSDSSSAPGEPDAPVTPAFTNVADCQQIVARTWTVRGTVAPDNCYYENASPLAWQSAFTVEIEQIDGEDVLVAADSLFEGSSRRVREHPTLQFEDGHCYLDGALVDGNDALMRFAFDFATLAGAEVETSIRSGAFCDAPLLVGAVATAS